MAFRPEDSIATILLDGLSNKQGHSTSLEELCHKKPTKISKQFSIAISVYCWLAASSSSLLPLQCHLSIELVVGQCFCVQRAVANPESLGSTARPPFDICDPPISGPLLFERCQ
ncbi:jg20773 [Pararge aegeria aegeria]|uniref:Jg20773 protein n=1 Tax=Pararge aegeria aegeria TaxID=348720 RepID=A0A8S4R066_9NEOP|nr:jg20773 [Pararge aegeria aegeria]